jgi:cytochrome P450
MLSLSVTDRGSAEGAGLEFFAFLQGLIDRARAEPSDDVVSAIVTARPDGEPFSARECLGLVFTTLTGALETTVSTIGSAVHLLATHPGVRRRLIEEPVLLARAVEEFLRMASPVQAFARTVTRDVDFHGHQMRAGDRVLMLYGSGNYDDERFPEPERFDLDRGRNPHLTFGHGIHKCAGQHLARLEIRVVVAELLARFPDFELASAVGPRMRGGVTWGFDEVRIRFLPAR